MSQKYIFLDEPTTGLDPQTKRTVWGAIKQASQNNSVILTTHSMEEADALCDRVGIMVAGQLRALGTPQHLKNKFGQGYSIVIQGTETGICEVVQKARDLLENCIQLEMKKIVGREGIYKCKLFFKQTKKLQPLWQLLYQSKKDEIITEYAMNYTNLEDVFLKVVNDIEPVEQDTLGNEDQHE